MEWGCTGADSDTVGPAGLADPAVRRPERLSKDWRAATKDGTACVFSWFFAELSCPYICAFAFQPMPTHERALYKNFTNPYRLVYLSQIKV